MTIQDNILLGTCISLIISSFALTMPLLLQAMTRINSLYDSIDLIRFFRRERPYIWFLAGLIICIVLLFAWIIAIHYQFNCLYEIISVLLFIFTAFVIIEILLLFKTIVLYNIPSELFVRISSLQKRLNGKKEVLAFQRESIDKEAIYLEAYCAILKFAIKNDDVKLANQIIKYVSTIFNTYRKDTIEYSSESIITYPPSYYNLIDAIMTFVKDNGANAQINVQLLLLSLYDTYDYSTQMSIPSIGCIWHNIIKLEDGGNKKFLIEFVHLIIKWSYKWSRLAIVDNRELMLLRFILLLQQAHLHDKKNNLLDEIFTKYKKNDSIGKYSGTFFPRNPMDALSLYSLSMCVLSTEHLLVENYIIGNDLKNKTEAKQLVLRYIANVCGKIKSFDILDDDIKEELFISFPRNSVYKYLQELSQEITNQRPSVVIDCQTIGSRIINYNLRIIKNESLVDSDLLNYYNVIRGSINQLYSHIELFCEKDKRIHHTKKIVVTDIERGENKRYFIGLKNVAGNAYFQQLASKLRTRVENIVCGSICDNASQATTYTTGIDCIGEMIEKIIKDNKLNTKGIIIINSFVDLSNVNGTYIHPQKKKKNKIIREEYMYKNTPILSMPISQSYHERNVKSIYIIRRQDAPFMEFVDINTDGWIPADANHKVYLKLGKIWETEKEYFSVNIIMKNSVCFWLNPNAIVWRIIVQ